MNIRILLALLYCNLIYSHDAAGELISGLVCRCAGDQHHERDCYENNTCHTQPDQKMVCYRAIMFNDIYDTPVQRETLGLAILTYLVPLLLI